MAEILSVALKRQRCKFPQGPYEEWNLVHSIYCLVSATESTKVTDNLHDILRSTTDSLHTCRWSSLLLLQALRSRDFSQLSIAYNGIMQMCTLLSCETFIVLIQVPDTNLSRILIYTIMSILSTIYFVVITDSN